MFRSLFERRSEANRRGISRVLILADRPNWAYDAIAKALVKFNDE